MPQYGAFYRASQKEPAIQGQVKLWESYDINLIEDTTPLRLGAQAKSQIEVLRSGISAAMPKSPAVIPAAHSVPGLIFDIGMSEGNDTEYYLAKGFRVVGVRGRCKNLL